MAFVQLKAEQSTSSVSSFTTTAMTVTAGNGLVACMCSSINGVIGASSSKGDSFSAVVSNLAAFGSVTIAVARNAVGGSTTFTATPSGTAFCSISAQEYTSFGSTNEAVNSAQATGSTAVNPGAVNPASAGDLYVACWTHDGSVNQTFTFNVSGEGWQTRSNLTLTANMPLGSQDFYGSGSKTGSATLSAAANWEAAVGTFTSSVTAATKKFFRPFPFKPSSATPRG